VKTWVDAAMNGPKTRREIRNIMEYSSGLIVCMDQNARRIEEYYGPKEKILPLLREEDLSKTHIKRMIRKGSGNHSEWEVISKGKFLTNCR
jgi:hypothetical protein